MIDFSSVKEIEIPEGSVKKIEIDGTKVWEKAAAENPLCFTAEQANSTVGYENFGPLSDINIQYSYDKINWIDWDGTAITLSNVGDKIYVRNTENTLSTVYAAFTFAMNGKIAASGNCNSMINYAEITEYCFQSLFSDCSSLTHPPELPATVLASDCYSYMFIACTSLIEAPELPATELSEYCYCSMFEDCSSLTHPPELPAIELANHCYELMFNNCQSLKVNENGSGTKIFTCPDISQSPYSVDYMFTYTGGSFTGTPTAGNTYYWYE